MCVWHNLWGLICTSIRKHAKKCVPVWSCSMSWAVHLLRRCCSSLIPRTAASSGWVTEWAGNQKEYLFFHDMRQKGNKQATMYSWHLICALHAWRHECPPVSHMVWYWLGHEDVQYAKQTITPYASLLNPALASLFEQSAAFSLSRHACPFQFFYVPKIWCVVWAQTHKLYFSLHCCKGSFGERITPVDRVTPFTGWVNCFFTMW